MKGKITEWNDAKGYGFISSAGGELKVFVHVSSTKKSNRRPKLNDSVVFEVSEDNRGRLNAKNVVIQGGNGFPLTVLFGLTFLVAASASLVVFGGELLLIPLYWVLSIITYIMYSLDKKAAQQGGWRTPESTLHLLSLFGGWPGALLAQYQLRHKSRKQPFKFILWLTVMVNVSGFVWLFTDAGMSFTQHTLDRLLPTLF